MAPLVNRTFEWGVVIATSLSVLSVVPRRCARLTSFFHSKLRNINAVPITLQPSTRPLQRLWRAVSAPRVVWCCVASCRVMSCCVVLCRVLWCCVQSTDDLLRRFTPIASGNPPDSVLCALGRTWRIITRRPWRIQCVPLAIQSRTALGAGGHRPTAGG